MKNRGNFQKAANKEIEYKEGHPKYPESNDMYYTLNKKLDVDPKNISHKMSNDTTIQTPEWREMNFNTVDFENDFDSPSSELDDEQESAVV